MIVQRSRLRSVTRPLLNSLSVLRQPSLVAVTRKHHGLGNRVRVVLGVRSLAELENRRFFYTWQTGREFGAGFEDLWQISESTIPQATARVLSALYPFRDETLKWKDTLSGDERVLQIRTPHALHLPEHATPWERSLQELRPVEEIQDRVRQFFESHLAGQPYVGAMVRAHPRSHAATLSASPLDWYLERMHEIRRTWPEMQFFLSADTREAQEYLVSNMPGVHSLTEKGHYNTKEGLRSAVADLYLLASSGHLLGPHFSSFPEMAHKLAGADVRLETSRTSAHTRLEPGDALGSVDDPTRPQVRH